jgi:type IV secretory pathway VirD2 relaxase
MRKVKEKKEEQQEAAAIVQRAEAPQKSSGAAGPTGRNNRIGNRDQYATKARLRYVAIEVAAGGGIADAGQ